MAVDVTQAVYAREPLTTSLILELTPLLQSHYREIAHYQDIELDPDWETYFAVQERDAIRVYTARDPQTNELLGYSAFFLRHNPHYRKSLQANNDVIFINKERRGFGMKFILWCDEQLKAEGVQVVYHHVKFAHDWSPMLERMGYVPQDKIMSRRLDL